jgi:hypothetical protein
MDFRYRVQAYVIDSDDLQLISTAHETFHENKHSILDCGTRCGKGNKPINNWYIPKLELMQSYVPSIQRLRVPIQWSADITEHAHVSEIKVPASTSNNNNYDPQICRYLDRAEKCRTFEVLTSMCEQERSGSSGDREGGNESDDEDDTNGDESGDTFGHTPATVGLACPPTHYFTISATLRAKEPGTVPLPLHTFCVGTTAVHLSYTPFIRRISVDEAADQFGLPDLRAAFVDYLSREKAHRGPLVHSVGGAHRAQPTSALPVTDLQIWFKVRIQNMPFHSLCQIPRVQTLLRPLQTANGLWGAMMLPLSMSRKVLIGRSAVYKVRELLILLADTDGH